MFCINAAAVSHIGNIRENNEDNYCFFRSIFDCNKENGKIKYRKKILKKTAVFGVFDGMGGMDAGEEASVIAAETARDMLRSAEFTEKRMLKICMKANERICDEMLKTQKRMGSTASMLCFENNKYFLCNLGDSPVFRLRGNTLSCISFSHIENISEKKSNKKKCVNHKARLTQYLGIFPHESELKPYFTEGICRVGDKFLLCSDGLSDYVVPTAIRKILCKNASVSQITKELLDTALKNGGADNVTIICVEIKKPSVLRCVWG